LKPGSVDAFLMIDVFHHVKKPRILLDEMQRALRPGGRVIMIEPANSAWGRFIWVNFHHEHFDPRGGWEVAGTGPMSDANGAMPWIVFCRDRQVLEKEFPHLAVTRISTHTPLQYLISGGLSIKQLLPGCFYPLIRALEFVLTPLNHFLGMFYLIELEKR
jgi:SAM-dependent methyltransferase